MPKLCSSLTPPSGLEPSSFVLFFLPASSSLLLLTHPKYLLLKSCSAFTCVEDYLISQNILVIYWLHSDLLPFFPFCSIRRNLGKTPSPSLPCLAVSRQGHSMEEKGQRIDPRSGLLVAAASSRDSSVFLSLLLLTSLLLYQPCVASQLF